MNHIDFMAHLGFFQLLLCVITWTFFIRKTYELQSSQTQVLLQLRKHLEYPKQLEIWNDHSLDFCLLPSSPQLNLTCQDNLVTELRIIGGDDKHPTPNMFRGFPIPNRTLSPTFSMDSFVTTLARLTNLRVLILVNLGIWGPFPDKIHRLSLLEYLDLSSNFLFGSIPPKISAMVKLRTLTLDGNFFNGTIPNWFGSLSNLTVLSLRNNCLIGPFPSSVQKISTLTVLVLAGNDISGKLPDLASLDGLRVLDLSGNKLSSELPAMPKGLTTAILNNNSLSGEIPHQYSQLSQLQHLDMSFNMLRGVPPASLFSLPNISYVNLASNMFSSSLPSHLICASNLGFVDISNNRLTGALPPCLSSESDKRNVKFDGNCLSIGIQRQHPQSYCMDVHVEEKRSRSMNVGIVVALVGGIFAVVVLLAFGFVIVCRRYFHREISEQHLLHKAVQDNSATGFSSDLLTNARFISQATMLGTQGIPVCRSFSLEELKEATKNFDNSSLLGEGSNGKLYKGKLGNGNQVAIRCLPSPKKYTIRNLKLRLDLLAKLRHPHLVCLLGHCIDNGGRDDYSVNKLYLIYEYVPNGSFLAHLSESSSGKVLNWSERLSVLIGIAKAVHFLHTGVIPGFFNNRLKSSNILLNQHGVPKLTDYGLSIISEDSNDYEPGEGLKQLQMKNMEDDVYSFGVILLESLAGPSSSMRREAFLLNELASFNGQESQGQIVNPIVQATSSQESLSIMISIANKCISPESWNRPSFEDILWNLQYAAQVQATADNGHRF